ncbi:MAG: hypothetical protein CMH55_11060 [Myxococcales bacterium]|nr:hypothetical protein [Myxococcales bacterium]
MATLSPLLQLLTHAEATESLADPSAYAELGEKAAELGQWALAYKAFQFARRRGQHRRPSETEWRVLMDYEHLAALIDRASEYQRLDLLEWVCANYAGHPDLHAQAVSASYALNEFGRPTTLDRMERQAHPSEAVAIERYLEGERLWLGWGLRCLGACFADRILRLGLQGIHPFDEDVEKLAHWVEMIEGAEAAVPYYRALYQAGLGGDGLRLALVMGAARENRTLALEATQSAEERSRLGLWVLQRGLEPGLDRRWLQDLDEADLETLIAQEAERLAAGQEARVRADDLRFSPDLAGRFQALYLAHGQLAEVIACLEIRLPHAEPEIRPLLLRMQASLYRDLGRDELAQRVVLDALALDPADASTVDLVLEFAGQMKRFEVFSQALIQHARASKSASLMLAGATLAAPHQVTLILEELAGFELPVDDLIDLAVGCEQRALGLGLLAELAEVGRLGLEQHLAVARDLVSMARGDGEMLEQALRLLDQLPEEEERAQRLRVSALLELGRGHEALILMHEGDFPKEGAWAIHRARALMQVGERTEAGQLLESADAAGSVAARGLLERLRESK